MANDYELKRQMIVEKFAWCKANGMLFDDAINALQEDDDIDKDVLEEILEEAVQSAINKKRSGCK